MAQRSGKGPAKLPPSGRKPGKDVITRSVEAAAAKVADLGDAVQKTAHSATEKKPEATTRASAPTKPAPAAEPAAPVAGTSPEVVEAPLEARSPAAPVEPPRGSPVEGKPTAPKAVKPPKASASAPAIPAAEPPPEVERAVEPKPPVGAVEPSTESVVTSERHVPEFVAPVPAIPEPPAAAKTTARASMRPAAATVSAAQEAEAASSASVRTTATATEPSPPQSDMPPPSATEPVTDGRPRAGASVYESMQAAAGSLVALNRKTIEAVRTNAEMTMDLMHSLIGARSMAEAVEIQAEHARHRFEVMSTQAREMHALARKMASEATAPLGQKFGLPMAGRFAPLR